MEDRARSAPEPLPRAAGAGSALRPGGRATADWRGTESDEVDATAARARYREEGISPVVPDSRIEQLLAPGESLLAVHPATVADSRASADGLADGTGATGDLYLTSARLVFAGGVLVAYALGDIEQAVIAGEDVLLVMRDGVGLRVAVDEPRLLRVQIAAARAARRDQVVDRPPYPPSR
jgi:hypothetical protein